MAPVKWMAAEVLSERKYSHYSDVVSLHTVVETGCWKYEVHKDITNV